jgi:hypothetical protein
MAEEDFDRLLFEAIDEGLSSIGKSSKQAIYYHLKKGFNLEKQDIPRKITVFTYAIEKIFGLGANFLEILIMKRLYEKIGGRFKWNKDQAFTFNEYIAVAKRSFLEKSAGEVVPWGQLMTES